MKLGKNANMEEHIQKMPAVNDTLLKAGEGIKENLFIAMLLCSVGIQRRMSPLLSGTVLVFFLFVCLFRCSDAIAVFLHCYATLCNCLNKF